MDELHESMLAAEGAAGAEQSGKSGMHKNCLNCGAELKGVYCHACGQKDLPQRQTTGELLSNFISSFSNYEGKFLLTVKYLLLRPGSLAKEYNLGHRERYFHPVRMYAFISFVFFLIFFSLPDTPDKKDNIIEMDEEDKRALVEDSLQATREVNRHLATWGVDTTVLNIDSMQRAKQDSSRAKSRKSRGFTLTQTEYMTVEAYDSAQAALPEEKRDSWFETKVMHRAIILNQRYKDDKSDFGKDFWKATLENFPKMLFFLLPVFALLLKLLYIRRNYFYSEHLVFSIYYYNFFYFAGSLMMLAGLSPALDWLATIIAWGIYIYLLFSMKHMYGQGWGKTISKFLLFSIAFSMCFFLGLAINLFIIVMVI